MVLNKIFKDNKIFIWILKKSKSEISKILILTICNILYALSMTSFALLSKEILDGVMYKNKELIFKYSFFLFALIILQFILKFFINITNEYITSKLSMKYRRELFSKLLEKEYSEVSQFHSSELLNRMYSDISIVTNEIILIFPEFINLGVRLICALTILISFNVNFLYLFLVAGIFIFAATRVLRNKLKLLHKEVQEKDGKTRAFFQEILEKLWIIKIFSRDRYIISKGEKLQEEHLTSILKRRNLSVTANSGFFLIFNLVYLFTVFWGSLNILEGKMTYGTLIAILQLVGQIQFPLANLSGFIPRIYKMVASAERVMELENLTSEKELNKISETSFEHLKIENLTFYHKEKEILSDVNLSIKKGDIISLKGNSGGGKTTLFLLLLGIYSPNKGKITIYDNMNMSFNPGKESRKIFSYVPQGNQLFSGTIRENISLFNSELSLTEIKKAAEIACAAEFIEKLPLGYETPIGQNGFGLSEGQGQRIAIARGLLTGAEFLLLDEATSALDEETEAKVLSNIENLKNKTCIIVTHGKAALKICNKHLYLKEKNILWEKN